MGKDAGEILCANVTTVSRTRCIGVGCSVIRG